MTKLEPGRRGRQLRGRPFRAISCIDARATPASKLEWFVTAHSTSPQVINGLVIEWPMSLVHAKRMGSNATACGIQSVSWPKLFHLPFPPARTEVCRDCLEAVRSRR